MAVYKVIQNVEAEDKLIGPLTLKSFIYAAIAATCAYINFRLLLIGSPLMWLFILAFSGPMVLFGVLASPLGRDQPTEVWLLSKIRFFLKPRDRVWDQEGMNELVTVTAPKKEELHLTKDLSQSEVHSRLKTLATTLDTRGWAIKNVDTNLNTVIPNNPAIILSSDRLVANAGYTQAAPVIDVHPADDILDEQNNPTAQKFASMMQKADEDRKHSLLATMKGLVGKGGDSPDSEPDALPAKTDLEDKLAKARASFAKSHVHKKRGTHKPAPLKTKAAAPAEKPEPTPVTTARQAVNMELAQSGSAFSVATLSQLANRKALAEQTGPNEITISLH